MTTKKFSKPKAAALLALCAIGITVSANAAFNEPLEAPLTFAGRIQGVADGRVDLDFRFEKNAGQVSCNAVASPNVVGGAFNAVLDFEPCDEDFFSGGDAPVVTITVTSVTPNVEVVSNAAVGAVPFARFADVSRISFASVFADTAARVAEANCPVGYEETEEGDGANRVALCDRFGDIVVKVGVGNTSFWMDRYEAMLVNSNTGTDRETATDFVATGRGMQTVEATSRLGVTPETNISWLQANVACRNAGKRLPRRAEWLMAAQSVTDPNPACHVDPANEAPRPTSNTTCSSEDGVMDLFGNVQEYMDEWAVGSGSDATVSQPFGPDLDRVFNVSGEVRDGDDSGVRSGLPAVEIRGGAFNIGDAGGLLFGGADRSPLNRSPLTGFRCVIPR
jgi:hypothetical protein